jgi:hypothetical protein
MSKTLLLVVVLVLALSGCGKKGSEAKGADCTTSVTNAVALSAEEFKKSGVTDAARQKILEGSITRCKDDKWSPEVLKCFADAKKSDDVSKCQQMMTKDQSDNLAKVILGAQPPDTGSGSAPTPDTGSSGSGSSGSAEGAGSSAAATGLPAECTEYKALIEKLAACDKMPAASRDMLKKSFDDTAKAWADFDKLPADAKTALTGGCKQSADALKKAAGPTCGF